MSAAESQQNGSSAATMTTTTTETPNKPKRVRTGCLTCRERHLKCDEGLPICLNCRKSNRQCRRGVRLNFIDTRIESPPETASTTEWMVEFLDESREIASDYKGGKAKYGALEPDYGNKVQMDTDMSFDFSGTMPAAPAMAHQPLPSIQGMLPVSNPEEAQTMLFEQSRDSYSSHGFASTASTFAGSTMTPRQPQFNQVEQPITPPDEPNNEAKEMLTQQDETLFMQVFVEEVGLWMDSMDPKKHFSRLLPFHALREPMLLNAFLACGVRHLTLVNPAVYKEEKALHYYDIAGRYLLRALQNPDRDSVICATTAVILNVYEIMTERALPRMNHIAGARALIKECGWNAKSTGIGAACFWINVGLEVLSNLHFNWQTSWHPDDWGLEMDITQPETEYGMEEVWTHRMLYIIAKIGNFRATEPRGQQSSPRDEQIKQQQRWQDWSQLKQMADLWNANIPRTMHPMAYLYPYQTTSKSAFPDIWLIKRSTIVARLFYHTALVLLAQINPLASKDSQEMKELEQHHAHQICGIVVHVKDRGVASVALRSLAIAAECLTSRREQEEVLQIFTRIHKETGWRIGFIPNDLRDKWGWDPAEGLGQQLPTHANPKGQLAGAMTGGNMGLLTPQLQFQYQFDQYAAQQEAEAQQQAQQQRAQQMQQQAARSMQSKVGIVNPLFASADFNLPKHPYQDHYVAPAHSHHHVGGLGLGLNMLYSQEHYQY